MYCLDWFLSLEKKWSTFVEMFRISFNGALSYFELVEEILEVVFGWKKDVSIYGDCF